MKINRGSETFYYYYFFLWAGMYAAGCLTGSSVYWQSVDFYLGCLHGQLFIFVAAL